MGPGSGMSGTTLRIEPLGKENFDTWKIQMEAILIKNDAWKYVNGKEEKPKLVENDPTSKEKMRIWEDNDQKAKSDLILAINPGELKQIKSCKTSSEVWQKLHKIYESTGPARKATLLKQLILRKMEEGENMRMHLDIFFDVVNKLEEMELKIVDDLVTILLLYSIPDSYENFRIAIESRDDLPKPELLKIKLLEEYEARKNRERESENSAGAFYAKKFNKSKNFHWKNDYSKNSNYNRSFDIKCNNCNKFGHRTSDRRYKSRINSNTNENSRNVEIALQVNLEETNDWCFDSGASSHMCSKEYMFNIP